MEELQAKWEEIKEQIRIEHVLTDISYNTWIVPLTIQKVTEDVVYIKVPTELGQSINYFVKRFFFPFKVAISEALNKEYTVEFVSDEEDKKNIVSEEVKNKNIENYEKANLNPKYTFNDFVVGSYNRFAQSAAMAVADSPGEIYNPLFIYGGVGLGKTHLMHAIAHYIIDNNPKANVLYVTSEQFTNEVIEAIRIGNNSPAAMKRFRDKYRNIDVLLIDDIQFIIGKESTQEEFFHTFNQLHEQKKQIIISSDKPPKDMDVLEERYKSRFGWGLIADIQSPEFESRMAILQKKMEIEGYSIDDEVLQYIANNVKSNIRELEGALNKLIAFSNLEHKQINIELAKEALKDIVSPNAPVKITPDMIITVICDHYNISKQDVISGKRNKELITPRYMICYFCRRLTSATYNDIGHILGNRDHSTIINGERNIEDLITRDEAIRKSVETLTNKLKSN